MGLSWGNFSNGTKDKIGFLVAVSMTNLVGTNHLNDLGANATSFKANGTVIGNVENGIYGSSAEDTAPIYLNDGSTVPTSGAPLKFLSATFGTGMGGYEINPNATLYFSTSNYASAYTSTITYTIVTSP